MGQNYSFLADAEAGWRLQGVMRLMRAWIFYEFHSMIW
jgi:hypothetical protein